jgi:DNA excision repair protein ERCC-2
MYADLLGIGHRRRVLRTYPSPFPRENRLLLVAPHVTTLFVKRGRAMHDAIAKEIADIASVVPGNVAAFFPSYELLEEAHRRVRAAHVPKRLLVERSEWSKTQRDGALEALRLARAEAGGALLLGVQGGSLSEGVDYHDNLLAAVIIVGLPLSPPSVEGEALRDYYARKFGFAKGHEYAVVYPAMNRLLQAAGRAIRSERDRAAIIILEGRLLEPRYARCLPPEFVPTRSDTAASDASRFLRQPLGPGSSPPSPPGARLAGA